MSDYTRSTVSTINGVNAETQKIQVSVNSKMDKSGGAFTGTVDMNEQRLINLPNATDPSEAMPLGQGLAIQQAAETAVEQAEASAVRAEAAAAVAIQYPEEGLLAAALASDSSTVEVGSTNAGKLGRWYNDCVYPEDFGAVHTVGVDDTAAFQAALLTGKRLILGPHTYHVNIVLTDHFDIHGQGMDSTVLKAFDKTKPVIKNMFQEPKWSYPEVRDLRLEGAGTREGIGFSFGDFDTYNVGDELIGRVRLTNVYINNFDKNILKCYGNIGNVFENVSTFSANYHYYARGAQLGDPSSGLMHTGADLFIGGQVTGIQKMVCLVLDTTVGVGQWTFLNTVFQFNPGGLFFWDVTGTSLTAWQAVSFDNIWIEGNATLGSVTIDAISGTRTITPSERFEQTSFGPDYCNWGKTVQHGTNSTLGRVNIWGNERIALNLLGGGIGSGDYVDLAFSSEETSPVAGAWLRSTKGPSFGRNLAIHTGAGVSADFNVDGGSTIGVASNTGSVNETATKIRANVSTGETIAAFVGPFSGITRINMIDSQAYSSALAGMQLGAVISTSRSLNAAGTINASGADYAEYMVKSEGCGVIRKGDICGITYEGLLTDRFDSAISFVVKSTDPAYVGGDNWGSSQIEPLDKSSQDWQDWYNDLEDRRKCVDRIAFSGQVPCNVQEASPGDYIVPVRKADGSIQGVAVPAPTLNQYLLSVGQVWKILDDGRAWLAVKVA